MKLGEIIELLPADVRDGVHATCKEHSIDADATDINRKARTGEPDKWKLDEGSRSVTQYMSTRHIDRDGEIVIPGGMVLSEYRKNPIKIWGHRYDLPPIGVNDPVGIDVNGIKAKTTYDDNPDNKPASIAWGLRKKGMLRTSSVGFIRLESMTRADSRFMPALKKLMGKFPELTDRTADRVKRITTKALLLEDSDVTIPANINATTLAVAKGELGIDAEGLELLGFKDFFTDLEIALKGVEPAQPVEPVSQTIEVWTPGQKAMEDIDTKPTESMAEEAQRGLDWRKEFNRGGTAVGVARANQLIDREQLSISTVKRMYSFFSRHETDKKAEGFNKGEEGYPSAGRIAWALWGGDAGFSWSKQKVAQIDRDQSKNFEIEEQPEPEPVVKVVSEPFARTVHQQTVNVVRPVEQVVSEATKDAVAIHKGRV